MRLSGVVVFTVKYFFRAIVLTGMFSLVIRYLKVCVCFSLALLIASGKYTLFTWMD